MVQVRIPRAVAQSLPERRLGQNPRQGKLTRGPARPLNHARIFVIALNVALVFAAATLSFFRIERLLEDALASALVTLLGGLALLSFLGVTDGRRP